MTKIKFYKVQIDIFINAYIVMKNFQNTTRKKAMKKFVKIIKKI